MGASIYDVAKRAGVSIATVSRVMNQSAGVKAEKAAAVQEALEYFHYEPSQAAKGLATGNSYVIGIYSPIPGDYMFYDGYMLEALRGITRVLSSSNYSLMLITEVQDFYRDQNAKPAFMRFINQKRIDGLIVLMLPSDGRIEGSLIALLNQSFPVAFIGKRFSEKGIQAYAQFIEYMFEAIKCLYEQDHTRVLMIGARERRQTNQQIKSRAEVEHPGLEVRVLEESEVALSAEELAELLRQELAQFPFTAILSGDIHLVSKLVYALNSMGKQVPGDISVLTVEHTKGQGSQVMDGIDAFYVPSMEMGEFVALQLTRQLQGSDDVEYTRLFHAEYQKRNSIKCLDV